MANEAWRASTDKDLDALGFDWSSAGDRFATVGDGHVKVWDPMTAAVVGEARLPGEFVGVTFSPLRLTPGYVPDPTFDHPGRGWVLADLETGRVVSEGQVDFDTAWLARSPDGQHAAIGGTNGEVEVLDLENGRLAAACSTGPAESDHVLTDPRSLDERTGPSDSPSARPPRGC